MTKDFEFRGHPFKISAIGSATPQWLYDSFLIERELQLKWWNIQQGDIVIDVGAAFGSYTLTALASGAGLVIAYEPNKNCLFDLVGSLTMNVMSGRCIVLNALAGKEQGIVGNYCSSTCSSYRFDGAPTEFRLCYPIDLMVENYSLSKINWIKVDVEGAEEGVVAGALKTIKAHKPKLLIENHVGIVKGIDKKLRKIIKPLGYVEETIKGSGTNENWSLWVPKGKK